AARPPSCGGRCEATPAGRGRSGAERAAPGRGPADGGTLSTVPVRSPPAGKTLNIAGLRLRRVSRRREACAGGLQSASGSFQMRKHALLRTVMIALCTSSALAFQPGSDGPYKVLKTAKVGGEGGTDYIYADAAGRRLYITRGATLAREAIATTPAVPAFEKRLTIFDLDTLEPVGVIPGVGGNGAAVCPNTGHGFTRDHPQPSMFDVKTTKLIKTIEVPAGFSADGIYYDTFNDRVYIGSHPTK